MTSKASFNKVQDWVDSVADNTDKHIRMILVGNKIDLPREVSKEEGKKMADAYGINYFETSAKENIGIDESMQAIINEVFEERKPKKDTVKLNPEQTDSSSKGGCSC